MWALVFTCVVCSGVLLPVVCCVYNEQVLCASVDRQPTSYEDKLVSNYLQFARQRLNELNSLHQRQFDELRRRVSTDRLPLVSI